MAREMYPEKFRVEFGADVDRGQHLHEKIANMISPEHFDKQNEEAQREFMRQAAASMGLPVEVADRITMPEIRLGDVSQVESITVGLSDPSDGPSPISRLFAAVRAVVDDSSVRLAPGTGDQDGIGAVNWKLLHELDAAYEALGLKDEN